MSELSERWCRAVPALKEVRLRAAFLRSELSRPEVAAVASALDDLAGRAEQADNTAREVLAAAMPALTDPAFAQRVEALRAEATAGRFLALGRLLRKKLAAPQGSIPPPEPDARPVAVSRAGRALTLGERKALARRSPRTTIDKLLRDPHPDEIRMLLVNPRITEDDVVRLAARRPAYPDVIAEIARNADWAQRARVRMAIVQNPGSPPEISVPMVRLLIRPELAQVIAAVDVAPIVRAAATELLQRRPPVPEPPGSGRRVQ
jgi:hypothetical protein